MRTLYIECNMGAAGDMLMAALCDLCPDPDGFLREINNIGLKNTLVRLVKTQKSGIGGNRIDVLLEGKTEEEHEHSHAHAHVHEHNHDHDHDHAHTSLADINALVNSLKIPQEVKEKAFEVYSVLAKAEAAAHQKTVSDIHFHEVGTLDAVCDIVGVCLALHIIAPEKIVVSAVHVGSGHVKCKHGILPVPAPATAHILRGVPIYGGDIKGELCTPTGAALLKTFASSFGAMPEMRVEKIAYGFGKKDFERLNCVRAFLGESDECGEEVFEISCNLDDITAEELAFSYDFLFEAGALDVFVSPCVMKKGRAAHILCALAREENKLAVAKVMLAHTTTRGVRIKSARRLTLASHVEKVETEHGIIDIKASSGYGIIKAKPEYESAAAAAKKSGVSFAQVSARAAGEFWAKRQI